jgi:ribokinase
VTAPGVAVVGHVEWVHFLRVARLPRPGEILHADASWAGPAGGGAMAAFEMARLGARTRFYTAHGDDHVGQAVRAALGERGLELELVVRAATPHPPVFTYLTDDHERTISLTGPPIAPRGDDPLPWSALAGCAAVYFCKGDAAALRAARAAPILVATARALPTILAAGVEIDVLIGSASDANERYQAGQLVPEPGIVVRTAGGDGGEYVTRAGGRGRWSASEIPGPLADTYGAGDSFAAGLTVALAEGQPLGLALLVAARSGARALSRQGA